MVPPTTTAVAYLAAMVSLTVCDYQVEVSLISYNNSAMRLQNGQCCDIKTNSTQQAAASCVGQTDTCDVRFRFSAENSKTGMRFSNQSVVVGPYRDSNVITFDRCCILTNGERNPLVFVIPPTNWITGETLRILAEIVDVDENSGSMSSEETIMSHRPILLLLQPLPPSNRQNYVQQSFFSSSFLNLTFQYRVVCTAGTCGSSCTQNTSCPPPPSACVPTTCADSPCLNGGTCSNVRGCSFSCTCREGYAGATCGIVLPRSSAPDNTSINSATASMTIASSSQDSQSEKEVQNCPVTAAVVSSILIFIFTSLLFLTIGIFIGYFIHKCKFTAANLKTLSTPGLDKRSHTTTPPTNKHHADQPNLKSCESVTSNLDRKRNWYKLHHLVLSCHMINNNRPSLHPTMPPYMPRLRNMCRVLE